jgi:hypothetical protein
VEAVLHKSNMMRFGAERIADASIWMSLSGVIGILTAFIISLVIVRYRHWYWVNSLLAFLLACLICRYDVAWHYLKIVFLSPGDVFNKLLFKIIINGLLILAIGFLLLFLNGVARFINKQSEAA